MRYIIKDEDRDFKSEILMVMKLYYKSEEKALEWYDKPNMYLGNDTAKPKSANEMVEVDKGKEVLKWINMMVVRF